MGIAVAEFRIEPHLIERPRHAGVALVPAHARILDGQALLDDLPDRKPGRERAVRVLEHDLHRTPQPPALGAAPGPGGIDAVDVKEECVASSRRVARDNGFNVRVLESDLFASLVLLCLAVEWWRKPGERRWSWALAAVVPLALLLSYPAVFVAGGVAPRLIEKMQDGTFMEAFRTKGRMSPLRAQMRGAVIMNTDVGLLGARAAAEHTL
jgi:hypothetical protein